MNGREEGAALAGCVPADLAVCGGARNFLQSSFWGRFKGRFGWEPRAFLLEWAGDPPVRTPLLVLCRRLAPGLSFAYVPWPELPAGDSVRQAEMLAETARALKKHLPRSAAFVRFDPAWPVADPGAELPKPFHRAGADVQPPDTVIVDLAREEAAILAGMKEKWRYNIRLAAKKGVTVHRARAGEDGAETIDAALGTFYALLSETARRDGISKHSREYYAELFAPAARDEETPRPDFRVYTALHEGEALAAIITVFWGTEAVYLYGASSDRKRNFMASYLLQWTALCDAKKAGCLGYDLFGISPRDDPSHPLGGLYRFKTGFGGTIVHRPGSHDRDLRPLAAGLFRTAEKIRKYLRAFRKRGPR